jgi:predicted nuclease with TOPRIM domain
LNRSDIIAGLALAVSVGSLVISGLAYINSTDALSQTKLEYEETTKPHTEFVELSELLNSLEDRINEVKTLMEGKEENENYDYWFEKLYDAMDAKNDAWRQLRNDNFNKTYEYYDMAHDSLDQIQMDIEPTSEISLICILIIVVILLILFVVFLFFDRGKIFNR